MTAVAGGRIVEPDAGVQTELIHNGAQIHAALAVLERVQAGRVAAAAAVELLACLGVGRERTVGIIAATEQLQPLLDAKR